MSKSIILALAILLAVVAVGCAPQDDSKLYVEIGDSSPGIEIKTDKSTYTIDDPVTILITNNLDREISFQGIGSLDIKLLKFSERGWFIDRLRGNTWCQCGAECEPPRGRPITVKPGETVEEIWKEKSYQMQTCTGDVQVSVESVETTAGKFKFELFILDRIDDKVVHMRAYSNDFNLVR